MSTLGLRRLSSQVAVLIALSSCSVAAEDEGQGDELRAYGGLREGSATSCAVLRVANEATIEALDHEVGLDTRAAANVAKFRVGDDGRRGTSDDRWFSTLADLDEVSHVGPATFKRLAAYARSNADYVCGVVDVQLLAFNDFHGNLKPPSGSSGRIATGPAPTEVVEAGGAEFFATHVKRLKAENPNTLVVAAGDIVGATPLVSALFHDEPAVESMNALGLDVATVGNHEFDEGVDELLRMQHGGCHPVDGCQDGDGFEGARFRYLSANVSRESDDRTIFPAYQIRSVQGARIAFIGVTLEGTPLVTSPSGVSGLKFRDEAETINALVPEIRKKGVEAIVVLIHEGGAVTGLYNECKGASGALFEISSALSPEIDVVIAGHTNQAHVCDVGGKLVTSAASFGRLVTDIDLKIDAKTGHVLSMMGKNVIATRDVPKDVDQTTIITKYDALAAPFANRLVGKIAADLLKAPSASGESTLGDVIADAQLAATRESGGAVIAFMNPGGVRADLVFAQSAGGEGPGEISYGEAFTVQPCGNNMMALTLTSAQIDALLEQQWTATGATEKAAVLHSSQGFAYTWDGAKPIGERIDPATITLDGTPIDPARDYRVTVNAFLADGGDGFSTLKAGTHRQAGGLDIDALLAHLAAHSPLAVPALDRITKR